MPSARTRAASGESRLSMTLAVMAPWSSRSDSIACLRRLGQESVGRGRLRNQDRQLRHVRIPFHQRRHGPQARERGDIELPDGVAHGRAVIVNAQGDVADLAYGVPGQMNFLHGL